MRVLHGFNARELLASLTSEARRYRYAPLPTPTSIRLLEVHPIARTHDGVANISVSLRTFPIQEVPQFQALSYTWGYPLIPESRPSKSSNWRRLAFVQRVQARSPRLLDNDGRGGLLTSSGTPSPPRSMAPATSLPSALKSKITAHTPCFPIRCEGRNLHVTANLHDALALFARKSKIPVDGPLSQKTFLWVDAL
jgi:hypothetical protein